MKDDLDYQNLQLDGISIIFGQTYFRKTFFKENPQCKGCLHVDINVMDYQIYPATKERCCKTCEKYKGW